MDVLVAALRPLVLAVERVSQRKVDGVEWIAGQYPTLVLEYARLVRSGVISAARRAASTRARAVEASAHFARGVKRMWVGDHGEGHDASLERT